MLRPLLLLLWAAVFCCTAVQTVVAQNGKLTKFAINTRNGNIKGYIEYLPPGFDDSGKTQYPVLYWLHGLGERGWGTYEEMDEVLNTYFCQWLKTHDIPFVVLAPQDHSGYWNTPDNDLQAFIAWASQEYKGIIQPTQQHLAGFSSGGYGIKDYIIGNTPACRAFSTFTLMSTNLLTAESHVKNIVDNDQYVWIFHGDIDINPNKMYTAEGFHNKLYALDSTRTRFTAFVDVAHSSWIYVYNNDGKKKQQLTGTLGETKFYHWTEADPDRDWYAWMLRHGKAPVNAKAPFALALSNSELEEGFLADTPVGDITADGLEPMSFSLAGSSGDNNSFLLDGATLTAKKSLPPGSYTVVVKATNIIGATEQTFDITVTEEEEVIVGNEQGPGSRVVAIYPNPLQGNMLSVRTGSGQGVIDAIELVNVQGTTHRRMLEQASADGTAAVDLGDLPAGMYVVRLLHRQTAVQQSRLVKTN
jgi:hypothetical protein